MAGFFSKKQYASMVDRIGYEVIEGMLAGVFNLGDVLQLVIDYFHQIVSFRQIFVR